MLKSIKVLFRFQTIKHKQVLAEKMLAPLNCLNNEELLAIQGAGSRTREGMTDPA